MGLETATIAGIASLASTGVSAGMSFAQSNKANRARLQAEKDARESMDEVKKRLEVNPYEALSINKQPYEDQRLAALSTGAQAIEAGIESERGAAATAGRVLMAENEMQQGITDQQIKDMYALDKQVADEQAKLNQYGVGIGLQSAEGAQKAAANYDALANKATGEAWKGVASGVGQAINLIPLFSKQNVTTDTTTNTTTGIASAQEPSINLTPTTQSTSSIIAPPPGSSQTLKNITNAYALGGNFNPFDPTNFMYNWGFTKK